MYLNLIWECLTIWNKVAINIFSSKDIFFNFSMMDYDEILYMNTGHGVAFVFCVNM